MKCGSDNTKMHLFNRKDRNLFGKNIESKCEICRFSFNDEEKLSCNFGHDTANVCSYYVYDPLKRVPESEPQLAEYSGDDFSL